MASRSLCHLTTRSTRAYPWPSIRASTVTIRFLSSSPCRPLQQQQPLPPPPPPPPPLPEYDYDPNLDHRFFPRLVREVRLSLQQRAYDAHLERQAPRPSKFAQRRRRLLHLSVACLVAAVLYTLTTLTIVPETGRWRCNVFAFPRFIRYIDRQAARSVEGVLASVGGHLAPASDPRVAQVQRILARLLPVSGLGPQQWETHVIVTPKKEDEGEGRVADRGYPSAFVVAGSVVQVYIVDEFLERVVTTDTMLAGVLAHELAHARLQHTGEGLTRRSLAMLFVHTATLTLLRKGPLWWFAGKYLGLSLVANGLWLALDDMPLRRAFETEADLVGLVMMAKAGYDPRAMPPMWKRLEHRDVPLHLLSTHPPLKQRIQDIENWMPIALKKWDQSAGKGERTVTDALATYTQEVAASALPADESRLVAVDS